MEFFTYSKNKRPVRLSQETRQFAYDSLHHKYGLDTVAVSAAIVDDVPGYAEMCPIEQYDACIAEIAKQARIRICPHEKLSGAATFGMAIEHSVPATFHGEPCFLSVSHLTLDFETVVKKGVSALEAQARTKLAEPGLTEKQVFF